MARIVLPAAWRVLTSGQRGFDADAETLRDALDALLVRFPTLRPRLLDDAGEVPSYVSIFVEEQSMKSLQGLATPLEADSVVMIVPAVVGG